MQLEEFSAKFYNEADTNTTLKGMKNVLKNSIKKLIDKDEQEINDIVNELMTISGLFTDNFNFIKSVEKAITERLNDISIDDNSNKNEKTVAGIFSEAVAPIHKAVGFDFLYRTMKEMYGKKRAKELSSYMYDYSLGLSDSTNIMKPYCYALDTTKLVLLGREFGQLPSKPTKRVSSYISALCETIHQMSSHLAGAIAVGPIFFDIAHLSIYNMNLKYENLSDIRCRKKYENEFQQFVHSVNHLSRNASESPFTNLTIFDKTKLKSLISDDMKWYFNEIPTWFYGNENDWCEYVTNFIYELQNIFLDFFDKGDPMNNGMPYRFPVVTANFSKNQNGIVDVKFLDEICNRDVYRYNIFISEGSKVASCCFDKNQMVLVKDSKNGVYTKTFEDFHNISWLNKPNFKIYNNGFWSSGKSVKINRSDKLMYKIITKNKKEMILTEDHINVCYDGEKKTCELTTNDFIMFNTNKCEPCPETNMNLTYEQGVLVGAYLGDGSRQFSDRCNHVSVNFSLNKEKYEKLLPLFERALNDIGVNVNVNLSTPYNNVYPVIINSVKVSNFISMWVSGKYCNEKDLNLNCLLQSIEFREGILDGICMTDGDNSNRIYTTSNALANSLEILINSIGKCSIIDMSDRTDENVIIREKEYNRNHVLYCIRYYDPKHKKTQGNVYKTKLNSIYFGIDSIEKIHNYEEEYVYCFEMENEDDPYFTLPNGIITHNCRLLTDTEMLEMASQSNSFGAGALSSLGSHRVVTINYNRLALQANSIEEFWDLYNEKILAAKEILNAHKVLIQTLADKGLQSFISNGWINMKRMFSTFGVLGIYECNKTIKDKFGVTDITSDLLNHLNDKVKEYSTNGEGYLYNIEQTPSESYAVRLAKADKIIYGNDKVPYELYANQFVPLWEDATIWEKLEADGKYNKMLTGGGIVSATIGEKVTPIQAKQIINFAVNCGCEHFALNAIYSKCESGHATFGDISNCPICGQQIIDKLSRVVGFFTPVSSWNKVRREWEFPRRTKVKL